MYGIRIIHCIHVFLLVCLSLCDLMFRERGNVWLAIISFFVKYSSARKDLCTKVVGWFFIFIWFWFDFFRKKPLNLPMFTSSQWCSWSLWKPRLWKRKKMFCLHCESSYMFVLPCQFVISDCCGLCGMVPCYLDFLATEWSAKGLLWDFSYNLKEKRSI